MTLSRIGEIGGDGSFLHAFVHKLHWSSEVNSSAAAGSGINHIYCIFLLLTLEYASVCDHPEFAVVPGSRGVGIKV